MKVAPFTGAWIEISKHFFILLNARVAPFTGAWIEIEISCELPFPSKRRSLHGSVD